jgi:predicted transcriptional regulator YheO
MTKKKKEERDMLLTSLTWGIPRDVGRDKIKTTTPKGTAQAEQRKKHMIELYEGTAMGCRGIKVSISNIARLYKMSRQRVYAILKDHIKTKAL